MSRIILCLFVIGLFALSACQSTPLQQQSTADYLYKNGRIYTVDSDNSWAEAMAINGDRIVFVGSSVESGSYVGDNTKVIDLQGRMVMPGIHDAHTHFLLAGAQVTSLCKLPGGATPEIMVETLKACAKGKPVDSWLVAGYYYFDQFPQEQPSRALLDQEFPHTPIFINEFSAHHGLANAKALEIAGLDSSTPDPAGGTLPRDADGELTGELVEAATWLVTQHIPAAPLAVNLNAVKWASKKSSEFGITSVQEAAADEAALTALSALDQSGELNQRVAAHVILKSPQFGNTSYEGLEQLLTRRQQFASERVEVDYVKMWIDGSPTPPYFTEAGYLDDAKKIDAKNLLVPAEELKETVVRLDQQGIKVKMHVAGAGAAHAALNAIAAARESNPQSTLKHELGHTNLVIPSDLPRFKSLNAIAESSPSVWHLYGETLGSPPRPSWQFRSLTNNGAMLTVGTDWPVTEDPNLFPALQGMLERGNESIELPEAVRALTINGAIAMSWDSDLGSLEPGKIANFIVLDQNIFDVSVNKISETKVLQTVFEGNLVYESPSLK